jgi:hypothetical protein
LNAAASCDAHASTYRRACGTGRGLPSDNALARSDSRALRRIALGVTISGSSSCGQSIEQTMVSALAEGLAIDVVQVPDLCRSNA